MEYGIAQENGKVGHAINNLQAQINLGLKKGYEGFTQEKEEVLNFLTDLYKTALVDNKKFIPFVITETVITYAWMGDQGPVGAHEPALILSSDKSPLYSSETDEEWKTLVEQYAAALGDRFQQFRVYVTYAQVETKIFQKQG
jgi:hypothetical protein